MGVLPVVVVVYMHVKETKMPSAVTPSHNVARFGGWLLKAVMAIAGLALLGMGIFFAVIDVSKPPFNELSVTLTGGAAAATLCLSAGLAIILLRTNQFESLEVFGLKAKMARIDEKIKEATATLSALQNVAIESWRSMGETRLLAGRAALRAQASPSVKEDMDLSAKARSQLLELQVDEQRIKEALAPWADLMAYYLYAQVCFGAYHAIVKQGGPKSQIELERQNLTEASAGPEGLQARQQRLRAAEEFAGDRLSFELYLVPYPGNAEVALEKMIGLVREARNLDPRLASIVDEEIGSWVQRLKHLINHRDFDDRLVWDAKLKF